MSFINHKHLIWVESLILLIFNSLNFLLNIRQNELRVLIYHHIDKNKFSHFNKQLFFIKKNWNFITPKQFENHISGKIKLTGKNVLLTFDDGFNSNFIIANTILKRLKIKCIFFVPSEFIKLKSIKNSKLFIKNNILDQQISNLFDEIKNISINNLKILIRNGHTIGAHTKTHANLGTIKNNNMLKDEMINSCKDLERILKTKIKHFAYTYGNYKSMSEKSINIAVKQYEYVHSSLRGSNYNNKKGEIIKRDAVYLELGNKLLAIFMNGIIDIKYFFQVSNINKLIKKKMLRKNNNY